MRERTQCGTLAASFQLAYVGNIVAQHLRNTLLRPSFRNSELCQLNAEGLSESSCLSLLYVADGFCHIGMIDRKDSNLSGTIVLQSKSVYCCLMMQ